MGQQIVVTSDEQVALKPLIESAIRSELKLLDLGLERTSRRLQAFEVQFGLASEEFESRFNSGRLQESLDFIEWAGEIKTHRLLQGQQKALRGARLN